LIFGVQIFGLNGSLLIAKQSCKPSGLS